MGYSNENFYQQIHKLHKTKTNVPTIDAHNHLVDFLQESSGIYSLMEAMEKANIKKSVIFGMPVTKKWMSHRKVKPSYYLSDNAICYYYSMTDEKIAEAYLSLNETNKQKIAPLICGFNPSDMNAVEHVKYLLDKYPFWRGIGEILCRHDDLTNLTIGEVARPNHPAMFLIYELCIERNIPIMIHQNASATWDEEWEGEEYHEYIEELVEALEKYPELQLVWAHCGGARRTRLKHYSGILDDLLGRFPNLSMDLSWVVYDDIICDENGPKKRWVDLFEKYPDRFMLGSDLLGHFDDLGRSLARYNPLIKMLSPEAAKKIAYDNANKMWFSERVEKTD